MKYNVQYKLAIKLNVKEVNTITDFCFMTRGKLYQVYNRPNKDRGRKTMLENIPLRTQSQSINFILYQNFFIAFKNTKITLIAKLRHTIP